MAAQDTIDALDRLGFLMPWPDGTIEPITPSQRDWASVFAEAGPDLRLDWERDTIEAIRVAEAHEKLGELTNAEWSELLDYVANKRRA